jgi:uncharacterized phage protein (TIGR02218 family)
MTFLAYDTSVELGQPIRLYKFVLGAKEWFYTSADTDQIIDGVTWKAVTISDNGFKQSGDVGGTQLSITTVSSIGAVAFFNGYAPGSRIAVTIFDKHHSDPEIYASYSGEVTQVAYGDPGQVVITCDTLGYTFESEGLRLSWQKGCPFTLYDPTTCRLNGAPLSKTGYVTSVDGLSLTVDGDASTASDGYFAGGYIEWEHPTKGYESRTVLWNDGGQLSIFGSTDDIYRGMTFTAFPGCARTTEACKALGNYLNYGGMPYLPSKSPFDGDPVF